MDELTKEDIRILDFVVTRELTLTDDDIERMKRATEVDLFLLEKRGIKLVQDFRQ
jgi:hypothetical protein